jgi:hypothetical protein
MKPFKNTGYAAEWLLHNAVGAASVCLVGSKVWTVPCDKRAILCTPWIWAKRYGYFSY